MPMEHAIPEESQEKTQGDKLDHATDDLSEQGTVASRGPAPDGERKPADEPLK